MALGDEGDSRGASMVEKHLQKLQQKKEEAASVKLQSLMPQFGQLVRLSALEATNWNPEKAAVLLRKFQVANASRLHQLHKKRKRILNALAKSSTSGDQLKIRDSGLESDQSSSFSNSSSPKRSKRKKTKSKKHHSHKKRETTKRDHTVVFGKYGIIRESDYDWKRAEFVKWASGVKHIDTESLSKVEEKRFFADFIEDFNTGSLPHKKYYDLKSYEKKKQSKRDKTVRVSDDSYVFNDEEDRRKELKQKRVEDHEKRIQAAYYELRTSEKAADMKEQEMLRLQMKLAYKTGDHKTAEKLAERLKPNVKKGTTSDLNGE